MDKIAEEWFRQAEYDMETATAMFAAKRYFYAVFMCHLSIEKALKALHTRKLQTLPPKTHNLIYLAEKISLALPQDLNEFLHKLNLESVATRYPDDLQKSIKEYSRQRTSGILQQGKKVLKWLKAR